jgi:hypothetical protein
MRYRVGSDKKFRICKDGKVICVYGRRHKPEEVTTELVKVGNGQSNRVVEVISKCQCNS